MDQRERHQLEQRDNILNAALECFADDGFAGTTMEDVAKASGCSVGHLYNFFKNKEDLYQHLVQRNLHLFMDGFSSAMENSGGDVRERLSTYVRWQFDFFERHPAIWQLYAREAGSSPQRLESTFGEHARQAWESTIGTLTNILIQGCQEGTLRSGNPTDWAVSLAGAVNAQLTVWFIENRRRPWQPVADGLVDLFLQGADASGD